MATRGDARSHRRAILPLLLAVGWACAKAGAASASGDPAGMGDLREAQSLYEGCRLGGGRALTCQQECLRAGLSRQSCGYVYRLDLAR